MQVQAHDFSRHLAQNELPPFILVFGDEPQQKLDIIDEIRAKAKASGFDERQNFTLDSDFEWSQLIEAMQSMSLFADKQYIELTLPSSKPGAAASKQFLDIAEMAQQGGDVVLVIQGPKAGKDVQKTKWFSALNNKGWFSHVYELQSQQLQKWLGIRAKNIGVNIAPQALAMITDLCEGNLMAGRQELEKLALQFDASQIIDANDIARVMVQQSRYSVFQFTDEILRGDMQKAIKMLTQLEDEGIEPVVILWSLVNEAQTLTSLLENRQLTGKLDFKAMRIWPNKQNLYSQAINRLTLSQLFTLNEELSHADVMFKSTYVAKPFVVLSHLALLFLPTKLPEFSLAKL
jgi:DNA polymerase-3 subunit delta